MASYKQPFKLSGSLHDRNKIILSILKWLQKRKQKQVQALKQE